MHQPTSYVAAPVLLDESPGAPDPVLDAVSSPEDPLEDPLVVDASLLAPVLLVDGSVEIVTDTDVNGSVVSGSSLVDDVPSDASMVPPLSPQASTVDNAQTKTHLDTQTITTGAAYQPRRGVKTTTHQSLTPK